jgi:cytosine/adenosine deaminase-related metal-dependent hydrolase
VTHTLLRGAATILTMDDADRALSGQDIRLRNGVVAEIGPALRPEGAEIVTVAGCLVTPGLVNTHHHLYQTLTRAVPAGQDALLFGWLRALYPIWARYTPEDVHRSTRGGRG